MFLGSFMGGHKFRRWPRQHLIRHNWISWLLTQTTFSTLLLNEIPSCLKRNFGRLRGKSSIEQTFPYICVCMCTYVHCIHEYIYIYTNMYISLYIYIYIYICKRVGSTPLIHVSRRDQILCEHTDRKKRYNKEIVHHPRHNAAPHRYHGAAHRACFWNSFCF